MLKPFLGSFEPDFVSPPESFSYNRVEELIDGVRCMVLKKVVPVNQFENFRSHEFQLRELIESGATEFLKPTGTLQGSKLDSYDHANFAADNLDSYIASSEAPVSSESTETE